MILKLKRPKKVPGAKSRGEETLALILKAGGWNFEREYQFHPTRKWRFDFALPDRLLAIEVEGGTKGISRHTTHEGFSKDCSKYNSAAMLDWAVLRYTPQMIYAGDVERDLKLLLRGL